MPFMRVNIPVLLVMLFQCKVCRKIYKMNLKLALLLVWHVPTHKTFSVGQRTKSFKPSLLPTTMEYAINLELTETTLSYHRD